MKRGKQKKIDAPGPAEWHSLIGGLNWRTNEVVTLAAAKKNSKTFCAFIELLMSQAPSDRPVFIVMDNASYHHSHITKANLATYENQLAIMWLPPYCSNLNPIERFWKHLKEKACSNRLFKAIKEMLDSVDNVLAIQNDLTHSDRLLFSKTSC